MISISYLIKFTLKKETYTSLRDNKIYDTSKIIRISPSNIYLLYLHLFNYLYKVNFIE
jgi:hypothetical protein